MLTGPIYKTRIMKNILKNEKYVGIYIKKIYIQLICFHLISIIE